MFFKKFNLCIFSMDRFGRPQVARRSRPFLRRGGGCGPIRGRGGYRPYGNIGVGRAFYGGIGRGRYDQRLDGPQEYGPQENGPQADGPEEDGPQEDGQPPTDSSSNFLNIIIIVIIIM